MSDEGQMMQDHSPQADALFERLREVCPSFIPVDDAARPDWENEPHPLSYIRAAALAWHLASFAAAGRLDLMRPVLDVAEATLPQADEYTHDLLVEGLLEDLQNACLKSCPPVKLVDVRALLGPVSTRAWDDLMRLWHGPAREARKRLPRRSLPDDAE